MCVAGSIRRAVLHAMSLRELTDAYALHLLAPPIDTQLLLNYDLGKPKS